VDLLISARERWTFSVDVFSIVEASGVELLSRSDLLAATVFRNRAQEGRKGRG
jgi:hypothetical protein